jgi:hypothetical protein
MTIALRVILFSNCWGLAGAAWNCPKRGLI